VSSSNSRGVGSIGRMPWMRASSACECVKRHRGLAGCGDSLVRQEWTRLFSREGMHDTVRLLRDQLVS
jgi:hypothetical protein